MDWIFSICTVLAGSPLKSSMEEKEPLLTFLGRSHNSVLKKVTHILFLNRQKQ